MFDKIENVVNKPDFIPNELCKQWNWCHNHN